MKIKKITATLLALGLVITLQACKSDNNANRMQAEELRASQKIERLKALNAETLIPSQFNSVNGKYQELGIYFNDNDYRTLRDELPIFHEMADDAIDAIEALKRQEAEALANRNAAQLEKKNEVIIYTVKKGDSLWKITRDSELYKHANEWPEVYELNKDKIKKADRIYPGQKFRLN